MIEDVEERKKEVDSSKVCDIDVPLTSPLDSPDVEFCGYSAPHPSEPKIHLRIQMLGEFSCFSFSQTAHSVL
jgi:hypothetical protein